MVSIKPYNVSDLEPTSFVIEVLDIKQKPIREIGFSIYIDGIGMSMATDNYGLLKVPKPKNEIKLSLADGADNTTTGESGDKSEDFEEINTTKKEYGEKNQDFEKLSTTIEEENKVDKQKPGTYQLRGQIYSRLMFLKSFDQKDMFENNLSENDNLFDRKNIKSNFNEYSIQQAELSLVKEGKKGSQLENAKSDDNGTFVFSTKLEVGQKYNLEAIMKASDRIYPERIICSFKVEQPVYYSFGRLNVTVNTVHQIKWEFKEWKTVDSEELIALLEEATLSLTDSASLVFDTFELNVDWISQDLSKYAENQLHCFEYEDGEYYCIHLEHLCLTTCVVMILKYYDLISKDEKDEDVVVHVAEAAARYYLDIHTKKIERPRWLRDYITHNPNADGLIQWDDNNIKLNPHNNEYFILGGVKAMLEKEYSHLEIFYANNDQEDPIKTNSTMSKCFLGLGWPIIVGDRSDKNNWDHFRVVRGLVIDQLGKILHAYVNDPIPSQKNTLTIKTDGTQSENGWIIISLPLKQDEVSPEHLMSGGKVPAPIRTVHNR